MNPFALYQQVNDITAFNILRKKYEVETIEVPKLAISNGFENVDTFVFIKKR